MTPRVGEKAPNISGTLSDGSQFNLESARGRPLVLFFYVKDFTVGCVMQVCGMRDATAAAGEAGAPRTIGISRDSPESHARFIKEKNLQFELLSDPDNKAAAALGALWFGGVVNQPKRMTFVIDGEGVLRGIYHHELLLKKHAQNAALCVEALQAGRACP